MILGNLEFKVDKNPHRPEAGVDYYIHEDVDFRRPIGIEMNHKEKNVKIILNDHEGSAQFKKLSGEGDSFSDNIVKKIQNDLPKHLKVKVVTRHLFT